MSGTSVIDIVAYAAYSKNNVRLRSSTGEFITPYIVKYQEKYYIALKKKGSGRSHYFHGLAFNLLDSFIKVPCTDAQGTCPDIEIIHEPDGWPTITSTKISDYTNTYDILHSGNFKNVIGNGSYWKVNDKTYNVTSNGSTSSEDMYLEMWRGTNSSWKMINSGGHLKFQNNYTTTVGNYFDVLHLAYNSGSATLKGNLNINGEGLYLSSSGTYPRLRIVNAYNDVYIQAGKGDGSAQEGYLNITGMNNTSLKSLTLKSTQTVIPGRVIIKNASAHDVLDVFTTYNAYTYLRLGRDYGKNNCSEFLYEYAGLNSTNNNLRIGFYDNSTSLLRGYAGGNWQLNNNLSINKEFNANDKRFNYALAYREIHGFDVQGMVVITLPNSWNNGMNLYEIDIYNYRAGATDDNAQHSKLTLGFYNYVTSSSYYQQGYTQIGSFKGKVRLAHDGTHCCILLGEPTSLWNYSMIYLSRVLTGCAAQNTWTSGYSIDLVTDDSIYTQVTDVARTRQRFSDVVADNFRGNLIGNADTASKWKTTRTLTVGNSAKTVDGSADVTWDLESILKNPTTIDTTTSWDITVPGVYGVASVNKFSGTNNPEHHAVSGEVYRYGQLIVSRSGHGLAQFYISHRDSVVSKYGIKYRTGYNSTYVSEWARLLDTLNYEKYVVKLDGHSLLWNNLYYTYKEVTMDTPDTVWYVKIVLSAYAQPNLIMINTGYNNRIDRAFLQLTGQFMGYFYRNNCQNQGNLTGLCLKTGYDSVEKKWIFWLRFRPINSTAAESPATSATCKVYLGQSNNAFDISATTTAPEGVTWETVGTANTSLLLRYATIRGNLIGNSDSATKAYLTYNNTSTGEYPIIWSNSNNTTSQNGSLFKSYSDLTYSPSNKRLTVKGQITSPQFYHSQTSASSTPIFYVKADNNDSTLLRVDYSGKSTFLGDYGYSLKYLGSDSNNRLALMADNSTATTQNVAIAFTNAGNVGIHDYANSDFSLHVSGKTNIQSSNFGALWIRRLSSNLGAAIGFHNTLGTLGYLGMKDVNEGILRWSADTNSIYRVWDEANDGPGSGLNADLLDGTHKSDLLSSITSTHTTNLSVTVGGTTKDVTKLWSSMLSIKDIRGTNVNPNDSSIQSNAITAWFNNTGTPTTNWYSGFSVKGWGNNYGVWQLCSYSSDSGTPTGSLYFRQGEDDTWKNWRTILDDSNTSVSGGGSNWGDSITVNINGTSTTLTIPNQPEDVNVTQTNTTTSANYRVLLSRNANDTTETASSRKSAKLYFNPSTGILTTTKVSANLDGDIVKKTPQLCEATESDNINIVENSNGAITNNYIYSLSAIRKAIQFRWYNTYWQIGNVRGGDSGTDGFGVTYGSNTLCFRVTETASYVYGSMYAVHFYESSDKRLKTNIQEILNSDKMPTIKEFDWKEDGSHSYGLIAQELEEQGYSELVSTKDNGYKTVNYSAALSLIVGKLQAKIKELEKEIENLRNKN